MNYRNFLDPSVQASEIGLGAWQLGNAKDWSPMADEDAIQLVQTAYQEGCTFFDTAPGYGQGKSEKLLGQALASIRSSVLINTKVGHRADGQTDFTASGIEQSIQESLNRLQTSYLDSVLLHNPPSEFLSSDHIAMKTLANLQGQGVLRGYGASVDTYQDMLLLLKHSEATVIEVLFNIFHQETKDAFQLAMQKGVKLIVKVPLDSGWLSGKYDRHSQFTGIRTRWSKEIIERRAMLVDKIRYLTDHHGSLTLAALRFLLAHQAVTTVIPGTASLAAWRENAKACDQIMPQHEVLQLYAFYENEIKNNPLPW